MYIRCPSCKASTRLDLGFDESKARCGMCGRVWSLASIGELGATPQERFESAQVISVGNSIDLASAYSVLLGLMSLETARELGEAPAEAVSDDGQHFLHGDRVIRASILARRHGLSMSLAFDVANGELKLDEALRLKKAGRLSRTPASISPDGKQVDSGWKAELLDLDTKSSAGKAWLAPVAIGLAVGGAVLFAAGRSPVVGPPPASTIRVIENPALRSTDAARAALHVADPPVAPQPPATEATTDQEGRITRISGRTPIMILQAFCDASDGQDTCKPVGIESPRPHRAGVRLGVLEKTWEPGWEFAISIRRNPHGNGWVAGTGLKPLQAEPLSR